ncbi:hypothetical protein HPB52_004994 [Rhipicephalus sanguineus]|uniref:Uncharacterized protein n=1 Tax=Rhipicephalus sanguineus TaxID=34632 RepID=A0A9D4Q927_RHISA|nr:hypothetical protein HPB52_004994 [Rhipicephalus sanguineus]
MTDISTHHGAGHAASQGRSQQLLRQGKKIPKYSGQQLSALKASESDFMVGDLFDPKVNGHACPDDLIRAVQQEANNNNSSFSFDDDDLDLDDTKAALSAKPEALLEFVVVCPEPLDLLNDLRLPSRLGNLEAQLPGQL